MAAQSDRQLPIPRPGSFWKWLFVGQRATILLASFILLSDTIFFFLHFAATIRDSPNPLLYLDTDRGYAEMFQYLKFLFILILLLLFAFERWSWRMSTWILVFLYLFHDDALHIHEPLGAALSTFYGFQPRFGFNAHDFGELAVSLLAGLFFLPILIFAYYHSQEDERWVFRNLTKQIAILGFLGVFLDFVHSLFTPPASNLDWFIILEDGGEMLAVTFMTLFILRLNLNGGSAALEFHSSTPQSPSRP